MTSATTQRPGRLEGKVAIVTGGSLGIGAATVQKFLSEGARVLIFDLNLPVDGLLPQGVPIYQGDVTKESDWARVVETCIQAHGKVDICVNNAGVVHTNQPSTSTSKEEYDRIMSINITPLYHSVRALEPHFKAQNSGVFVNLSSISAPRPRPGLVWYAGSKGAVSSITRGLAAELAPYNIRCNAVLPVVAETGMVKSVLGGTDSAEGRERLVKQIPLGRICTPQDVASAVCFLSSEESSFITGIELPVDGGRSLM